MARIPVPIRAARNFLAGSGSFEFASDGDAWSRLISRNQPFARDVDAVAEVKFGADVTRDFSFGRRRGLTLRLKAGNLHQAEILWPERDPELLRQYGLSLPPGRIYARVVLRAEGSAGADAGFPAGPLSATVGITAGGAVCYERWIQRPEDTPARQLLAELYGGIRLPQHVDEAAEIPEPGELLVSRFRGYLRANSGLNWGYSITGTKDDLSANRLNLDLDYKLRALAAVTIGYKLAGEFQLEARAGSEPGWVRFVVRKSRESQTGLAADFAFDADLNLRGLPASADEFLSRLLGTHADRALELFDRARAYADLKGLEEAAGKLLKNVLRRYSQEVLNIALSDSTVQEFLARMRQVTGAYAALDRRIIDLYKDVLEGAEEDTKKILPVIDLILGQGSRQDLLALSGSAGFADAIDLLRRLYNERLSDVLRDDAQFAEAAALLSKARSFLRGEAEREVKAWIDLVKAELPVNELLRQLGRVDSPEEIRTLADEKLQGLVEQLTGTAFHRLSKSDAAAVFELVSNNLERVQRFKEQWYKRLREAVQQSFRAKLHLAYTRSRANERLLDVEIRLDGRRGRRLARAASRGDFGEILESFDTSVVRIHRGLFTEELKSAAHVKVNVLGWGMEGVLSVVLDTEHAIEPQGGGLLHVYSSRGYVEKRKKSGWRFQEELAGRFLIQALGETFQADGGTYRPYAVDVLRSMSAQHTLLQRDENTTVRELAEYLRLAAAIGLLDDDPALYAGRLAEDCGGNLGAVAVSYSVQFGVESLKSAFHFSGEVLEAHARNAMRDFILRKYGALRATDWLARVGFAYASEQAYRWYRQGALRQNLKAVVLPAWFTGNAAPLTVRLSGEMVALVETLFRHEDTFVKSLLALDGVVDDAMRGKPIRFDSLNRALEQFLKSVRNLQQYDSSAVTAIFDRLIQIGSGGAAPRDSAVLIEVTPRQGPLAGQKITRLLASGPKDPGLLAEDTEAF